MARFVMGLFDEIGHAHRAVSALRRAGFAPEEMSLVANDVDRAASSYTGEIVPQTISVDDAGSGAVAGVAAGGLLGGIIGLAAGLAALLIPGIGAVIAFGPLVGITAGAAAGAIGGGVIGALTAAGATEEHAHIYAEGLRRGGTLLSVKVHDDRVDLAEGILRDAGAVDTNARAAIWRAEGWKLHDPAARPLTPEEIAVERRRAYRDDGPQGDQVPLPPTLSPAAGPTSTYSGQDLGQSEYHEDRTGHTWDDVPPEQRKKP